MFIFFIKTSQTGKLKTISSIVTDLRCEGVGKVDIYKAVVLTHLKLNLTFFLLGLHHSNAAEWSLSPGKHQQTSRSPLLYLSTGK